MTQKSPQLWRMTVAAPVDLAERLCMPFDGEVVALTVMKPPRGDMCRIEAIFDYEPDQAHYAARFHVLAAMHGAAAPECTVELIAPENWLRRVAQDNPPRKIGRLIVYGRHDRDLIPPHTPSLMIEAATAFGTGEHPSTQMCLLLLQDYLRRGKPRRTLDLGCGSGILALALARLARRSVLAVDNDAESVRMTRHNARVNGLQSYVHAVHGEGYNARAVREGAPYDLIFANIFARPLADLADDLQAHLAPGGVAILAGLLQSQAAMVQSAHGMQRLRMVKRMNCGEWAALMMVKGQRSHGG